MREILFRGVSEDTMEWVEGWFEMYPYGRWPLKESIIPAEEAKDGYCHHVKVIPETVGQFTGLTDKNGKKIFEGDIIRAKIESGNQIGFTWPNMPVGFQQGSFCLNDSKGYVFCTLGAFAPSVTLEVIGNIHDNPELLNGGGDFFEDKTESGLLEE